MTSNERPAETGGTSGKVTRGVRKSMGAGVEGCLSQLQGVMRRPKQRCSRVQGDADLYGP
jgi:hypothetical protein